MSILLENFHPSISKRSLVELKDPSSSKKFQIFIFEIKFIASKLYTWLIKKSYQDFASLSKSFDSEYKHGNLLALVPLPSGEKFFSASNEEKFLQLECYLQDLERIPEICSNQCFWEFLEVSVLSFDGSSSKRKEGYVQKRTGGRISNENLCCNLGKHFKRLQKRWVIIKDNMIGYLSSHMKGILHEVLMFKGRFEVSYGSEATGFEDGVLVTTTRRNFLFRAGDLIRRNEWVEAISEAYEHSEWRNPDVMFDSSFPSRYHNYAKWYVDGLNYYSEVMEALQAAKREVYISDWWLSPEMYLRRPSRLYPNSQIAEVLGTLADRGVQVCVCVYKEVSFALTLNSLHTKRTLQARNTNIKVIRHPHRSVAGGQFLWSHHEKIVSIDHETAFIGGLDLCFGRMDTSEHLLTDNEEPYIWNGIDYSNVRLSDFTEVEAWERDSIDRNKVPRMPWHDVAVKIVGKAAGDVTLHFIELWNHVMTDILGAYWKDKQLLQPQYSHQDTELNRYSTILEYPSTALKSSLEYNREVKKEMSKSLAQARKLSMLSVGSTAPKIDAYALDKMIDLEEEEGSVPVAIRISRMAVATNLSVNPDVERREMGTRNRNQTTYMTKRTMKEQLEELDENNFREELEADQAEGDEAWAKNLLLPKFNNLKKTGHCQCQVVRSAGMWSLGLDKPEHSVHAAYLHLIAQAKHFIYIENQFFISSTAGRPVKNQIAQALVERIKIAAALRENFKVIVMMPLLPGFEGRIEDSSLLRVQLYWEYQTICRGLTSIYEQLKSDSNIVNVEDYISFYSLRNHGEIRGLPVTEIVYIHSKLMIVDDEFVIMGSANINDRSLLGKNDSEIAVVIDDDAKIDSILAGENVVVSEFAHTLRVNLFKEFLNNTNEDVLIDPLSDSFTSLWITTAQNNTALFKHIFRCYPDNEIKSLDQVRTFEKEARLEEYQNLKDGFKGMLVQFPLDFLKNENLKMSIFNKEYLLPEENFV